MFFVVRFTAKGKATLQQQHISVQKTIKRQLKKLAGGIVDGKPLTGKLEGFWSLRSGNYRSIYTIERNGILVHRVGHRRDIYDDTFPEQQSF